jgi:galactose mutarotase-like enzyme
MSKQRLTSDLLAVDVNALGAELTSIRHRDYGELLWQAEPIWPKHAPNLFPIVGELPDDSLLHDGKRYTLKRHGFAREREFAWQGRSEISCALALESDAETQKLYPFQFRFVIGYALTGAMLTVDFSVTNTGSKVLPASVGAHPAFCWPLKPGIAKEAHTLEFSRPEPNPIRRLQDGLLQLGDYDTPVVGSTLHLRESLFTADAVIFDRLASDSVRYSAPGAPTIEVSWNGFRDLGVWSKEGAAFLCIEPWYGYSTPIGFEGDFEKKPGLLHIAPGQTETLTMRIRILDPSR